MKTSEQLKPERALAALIDLQERHYPSTFDREAVRSRCRRFLSAARLLEVPVLWTEHYPRAFGPTIPEVADVLEGLEPISKTAFGCFGESGFSEAVSQSGRDVLVLLGSETHICIQQTALGALERGLSVVVLADCVNARRRLDHDVSLRMMAAAGVVITTWESLVYHWMEGAGHLRFKEILPLVKEPLPGGVG